MNKYPQISSEIIRIKNKNMFQIRINPQTQILEFTLIRNLPMNKILIFALLCTIFFISHCNTHNGYCSSTCIDYTGACFDQTYQGCWVCANSIFNINADLTSSTPCSVAPQTTIVASQLQNSPSMSLAGYTSSSPTPLTCTNYTFSGQYVSSDFLYKNFTNIPSNHYAMVVRFNVGYMGFWNQSDTLRLSLQDGSQIVDYDYNYSCEVSQNICGELYNTIDCIRVREYTMTHNSSYLELNFTALTNESDPSMMAWGIKELIVAAKLCHSYCQTCFDGTSSGCLSCASGYFLQGNVCVASCGASMYEVTDIRTCSTVCPTSYYAFVDSGTGVKSCQRCQSGCLVCSGGSICQAWENQEAYVPDLWKDKMEFWILLIIVVAVAILFILYKIVAKLLRKPNELEQKLNNSSGNEQNDTNSKSNQKVEKGQKGDKDDAVKGEQFKSEAKLNMTNEPLSDNVQAVPQSQLWFNQLLELQPTEVKVSKRKRRWRENAETSALPDLSNGAL